ncbi:hypothetical protein [Piscinibacter sakaiensis]|uniref:hypothetical protein n=1 Tax=Piscinibacter sakaiensis TaxID=1547922 RepID=UPI003AAF21A4
MTAWLALYLINDSIFSAKWAAGIDWIFLPAAARLISVLVFGPLAAIGLFLGSLISMLAIENSSIGKAVGIAITSALAPLVAVELMLLRMRIERNLTGVRTSELMLLAFGCAALSVSLHNLYYWATSHRADPLSGLLPMFIGDIVGTLLVFYSVRSLSRAHARFSAVRQR